jgi:hypothetical protein
MAKNNSATPEDVAHYLSDLLDEQKYLDQADAVFEVEKKFGRDFVYSNELGNDAIDQKVLDAFKKLTEDTVVWSRSDKQWRHRSPGDTPGRQQE